MPTTSSSPIPTYLKQNIQSVAQLEQQFLETRSRVDKFSDAVSGFVGSLRFIAANLALFGTWIVLNLTLYPRYRFDPSFTFLAIWALLEGLFLTAFLMISQNRQRRLVDHWAHVSLQVSLLAEQEMTKMLQIQQSICDRLGMTRVAADLQLNEMIAPTNVETLVEEIAKVREVEEIVQREDQKDKASVQESSSTATVGDSSSGAPPVVFLPRA